MVGMRLVGDEDVELRAGDVLAGGAVDAEVVFGGEAELGEFGFEGLGIEAKVEEGRDAHVAADAGETIEKKGAHLNELVVGS